MCSILARWETDEFGKGEWGENTGVVRHWENMETPRYVYKLAWGQGSGDPGGTRTPNTQFRRLMLYPLSYRANALMYA